MKSVKEPFLKKFYSKLPMFPEMDEIDHVVHNLLKSNVPTFDETIKYLYDLGGKKIRPYIFLIVAHTFSKEIDSKLLINLASAIELLHTSSLYHDDIIDNAQLRRNNPTANLKFGLANSLLAGNFLYIRAFALLKDLNISHVSLIERVCLELAEGEALESNLSIDKFSSELSIKISRLKTGSLFKLATYLGASISSDNQDFVNEMTLFGENLGIAFQIFDDISDITLNNCGKNIGQDLRAMKPSIVNSIWIEFGSKLAKEFFNSKNNVINEDLISQAIQEIRQGPIIEQSLIIAKNYQEKALNHLLSAYNYSSFRNEDYFSALEKLTKLNLY